MPTAMHPGARSVFVLFVLLTAGSFPAPAQDWPQWGGPNRNFVTEAKGLASAWPSSGPRQLWSRELGEGYSAIAVERGVLYTMYRPAGGRNDDEAIVAIDSSSGKTMWEHRWTAPFVAGMRMENGPGPHVTPLVAGNLVYAVGTTGRLFALQTVNGRVVWSKDLWKDLGGQVMGRGYSCSPIAWKDTIILTLGGPGQSVVALRQKDGGVVWKSGDFDPAPSSPLLINVDGQDQLVVLATDGIVGMEPNTGALLWRHPHKTDYGLNISTPVWTEGNLLFVSSAYSGGSRMLKLAQKAGKTAVTELWFTRRMRIHIGNAIRVGPLIYGSNGDFGPSFVVGIDVHSGEIAFQERGFSKANFIYADGKLIVLDEDGNLGLATPGPGGLKVLAKTEVLTKNAWTAPTLSGTRLYIRDRRNLAAFDLR